MNIIYNIMSCDFVQSMMLIRRRRIRHHSHSGGYNIFSVRFLVFLMGLLLIYVAFKTNFVEKIASNEFVRKLLKAVLTVLGIGIIIISFTVCKNQRT